jgi:sterol 3beta-glucosyltransferase
MKICILTIGTRGDVQPYIALAVGLKEVGHEVTIATLSEYQSLVEQYGLKHTALRGDFLKAAQTADKNSSPQRGNPLRLIRQYQAMAKDTLADEWASAKDTEVFIYNPAAIGAFDIADKLGVPAFAAFPAPLYTPTREFPSPFFPFRNLGPFNKTSHKFFAKLAPAMFRGSINAWRREVLGLTPAKTESMLRGKPIPTLYAYSDVVIPRPADWDRSAIVTGYWFLDAPKEWRPDPALVRFIANGPAPVYVGFGSMSMFGEANNLGLVAEALRIAGQRGIVTRGDGHANAGDIPDHIFMVDALPHDWLFPKMAAVVHHGGAGTTGASLRAGIPTVICPFVGDQSFWGRRVATLGVGPSPVPIRKLTVQNLATAIKATVTDELMQQRALALGEILRTENGVGRAVEIIQSYLMD